MTRRLTLLFATAVGTWYYAQPLLADFGATFGVSRTESAGLSPPPRSAKRSASSFVVPLGDIDHRCRLSC
jgi:hypothetical protein